MNDLLSSITIISTGLFSGLMMTLVFLLQRQWTEQDQTTYSRHFREFLLVAKGHPLITLLTFVSFVVPAYLAINEASLLYAAASAVFLVGCFVVTVFLNLPIYQRVINWKTASDSSDWKQIRSKFFVLNVIRFSSSLASLVLLLVAS